MNGRVRQAFHVIPICDYDWKAVRPAPGALLYVRMFLSFAGTVTYRRHWPVHLSDEIFIAVILFAFLCYSNTQSNRWDLHVLHVQPS